MQNKRHFSDPGARAKLTVQFVLTAALMLLTLPVARAAGVFPGMPHPFHPLLDVTSEATPGSQGLPEHLKH